MPETPSFCPLPPLRFVCDEMLQSLAQWLRVAGYDTVLPRPGLADRSVLAMARNGGRWLLTRDRKLLEHRGAPEYVLLLVADDLERQVHELNAILAPDWLYHPFSRCKRCNTPFRSLPVSECRQALPPAIARDHASVSYCEDCGRYFWDGSHVRRMQSRLEQFQEWARQSRRD